MLLMLVAALAFVAVLVAADRDGDRRLPWARLLLGALVNAGIAALPFVPTLWWNVRLTAPAIAGERALMFEPLLFAWITSLGFTLGSVRLPRRLRGRGLVDAPAVVRGEVAAVAGRLGLAPPAVRQLRVAAATSTATAFAWGWLRPVVIVGDGIMLQLDAEQRAALLAHELAHVRSRDVLSRQVARGLVYAAAIALAPPAGGWALVAWMVAANLLVQTTLTQPQELAADAVGAQLAGADAMRRALDKVHAANHQAVPFRGHALFHAVASHPAMAVRAAALAPADADAQRRARPYRRARRVLLPLWAAVLVTTLLLRQPPPLLFALTAACLLPPLLWLLLLQPLAGARRDLRQLRLRARRPALAVLWLALLALVAFPITRNTLFFAVGLLLFAVSTWRLVAAQRRRLPLQAALMQHDFAGYLRRFAELSPRLQRRPDLAIEAAIVRAAGGEVDAAIAQLRALGDHPGARYHVAWLLARRDPARAQAVLAPMAAALPDNAPVQTVMADIEARLGDLASAARRVDRVAAARPADGICRAVAARIARLGGDRARAQELLARAEALSPGEPTVVVERALHDIAAGSPGATASVQRLREVATAVPLALLTDALAEVERTAAAVASPRPEPAP